MKTKTTKRKIAETAVGAAVGGVIAGPVGAVAGVLVAGHVEEGLDRLAKFEPPADKVRLATDDPLIHAFPKRILVPLDFSPPSQRALRFARAWATLFGAEICLLHVIEPAPTLREPETLPMGEGRRDVLDSARVALETLAHDHFPKRVPVKIMVRQGRAYDQIATVSRNLATDLIIIATHGYTGLKHVLLGSTAERVARHAPCPVLILRRNRKR